MSGKIKNYILIPLILILFSTLLAALIFEFGFRIHLIRSMKDDNNPVDKIPATYSDNFWQYNENFGFNYVPNGKTDLTLLSEGMPIKCLRFRANAAGNPGHDKPKHIDGRKTYVFGDSFTFYSHGPNGNTTWPDLLEQKLNAKLPSKISITNFARDGTGILQMFDAAAHMVQTNPPELIIIAFISPDLARARFWRLSNGKESFVSVIPGNKLKQGDYILGTLLEPKATKEWCEQVRARNEQNDPLLVDMRERYFKAVKAARKRDISVRLWAVDTSYVYNQIKYKDPFYTTRFQSAKMNFHSEDYLSDPQFVRSLNILKQSKIPILLVHLPYADELRKGDLILDTQQKNLLQNLGKLGFKIINVRPTSQLSEQQIESLFLLPVDGHPTFAGLEYFAQQVAQQILDENYINSAK